MDVKTLLTRARTLQEEVKKAAENVQNLTQQLNQATLPLHAKNGQLNEIAYLLGEAQKEEELKKEQNKGKSSKK